MQPIEYLIFIIPFVLCSIPIGAFLYLQKVRAKQIQVYVLRKMDRTYKVVKRMKIKNDAKEIKYNGKIFTVNLEICIFDTNNKPILYYDYDNCEPINPFVSKADKNPENLETFLKTNIYPKIFGTDSGNFLMIILIVVCVVSIVISAYSVFMLVDMQNVLKTILSKIAPSVVIK